MSDAHQKIVKYNIKLSEQEDNFKILDYVNAINVIYNQPIDLSFIDELMGYITQYIPCVPHTLLVKYGVFTSNNVSNHVRLALEKYNYVEGVDFKLANVRELENGKTYHKKIYYLTPTIFKKMLMRSKNSDKYADYYILLETSIKYYSDYQQMRNLQIRYNAHIRELEKTYNWHASDINAEFGEGKGVKLFKIIGEQSAKIDNQSAKIDELLKMNKDQNTKLDSLIITVDKLDKFQDLILEEMALNQITRKTRMYL